jgi:hypothetical protein
VRAGVLTRLRRDRYALAGDLTRQSRKIANELVKPSALSLWTALSDAGVTTQAPRAVQSVTPKRAAVVERDGAPSFQYVHLPEELFFDVRPDSQRVLRVSPEKALLDLLYLQRGRLDWASIDWRRLDRGALRRLAARYPEAVRTALAHSPSVLR